MLLDSNIIIYSVQSEYAHVREFIKVNRPHVSVISYVEVLGYHKLSEPEKDLFESFFQAANMLQVTSAVITKAITLRQEKSMSLGDALIAGTALEHDLALVTRNIDDFSWIDTLRIINPLD